MSRAKARNGGLASLFSRTVRKGGLYFIDLVDDGQGAHVQIVGHKKGKSGRCFQPRIRLELDAIPEVTEAFVELLDFLARSPDLKAQTQWRFRSIRTWEKPS
jgi:hypothetical protein